MNSKLKKIVKISALNIIFAVLLTSCSTSSSAVSNNSNSNNSSTTNDTKTTVKTENGKVKSKENLSTVTRMNSKAAQQVSKKRQIGTYQQKK